MKKIMLITLVALGAMGAQAALVVDLSGNFNTATSGNINYNIPANYTAGNARIYDNDFGTAIITNGTTGTGGAYVGPAMYAAMRHSLAGVTPPAALAQTSFRMGNGTDAVFFTPPASAGVAAIWDYMIVFKKVDFANGLNTGSIGFDATSSFAMTNATYTANTKSLRAVVQNGSTWYVSQTENTVGTAAARTILADAASARWAVWDPLTSIDVTTLPDFSTTVAGSTFTNIQAVGIYSHQTKTDSGSALANMISSIQIGAVAVPEPATVGMLGLGAVITLLVRRMRS